MKTIKRDYLDTLIKVKNTPDIKIITGVRRCGKSTLLEEYIDYIRTSEPDSNIIYINFNSLDFESLREYHALNDYIEKHYVEKRLNYLFIDEIQLCEKFELTINSLHNSQKYDIYITGSNAFLLSSDLATLFTGRTYTIETFPFSFREYCAYHDDIKQDQYQALKSYLKDGGMAGSYVYPDEVSRINYITEVYKTLILRDIVDRHKIGNSAVLEELSKFLMDNISNITSINNLTNALISRKVSVSDKTVNNYVKYLCEAFAFYKLDRYNIKGKEHLASQSKYYLSDLSFRRAVLGSTRADYGRVYENIVAIELLRRGYEVYVGTLGNKEIDFVAIHRGEKIYIQVAYDISDELTFAREITPLLEIKDAYPKIIIGRTSQPEQQHEGVKIIDLADWLLDD